MKSLIEGIDVPAADTGISVASTSSVRQRVQALGRVLRRSVTEAGVAKVATMHLIYVRDTVDELIYGKADWTDLTGGTRTATGSGRSARWSRRRVPDPPRTPKPTEEQAWDLLGIRRQVFLSTGRASSRARSTRYRPPASYTTPSTV